MNADYTDSIPMKTQFNKALLVWAHRLKAECEPLHVPEPPNSLPPHIKFIQIYLEGRYFSTVNVP